MSTVHEVNEELHSLQELPGFYKENHLTSLPNGESALLSRSICLETAIQPLVRARTHWYGVQPCFASRKLMVRVHTHTTRTRQRGTQCTLPNSNPDTIMNDVLPWLTQLESTLKVDWMLTVYIDTCQRRRWSQVHLTLGSKLVP